MPNEVGPNGHSCTVCIGTIEECKSADSWYGSKLMYWVCKTLYGQQSLTEETFSYLPDPVKFDHIFTDQELYEKYNLTDQEINIIESVIKERKPKK
jgi:site-specific DNA-methyltransferase (adenine-specific)